MPLLKTCALCERENCALIRIVCRCKDSKIICYNCLEDLTKNHPMRCPWCRLKGYKIISHEAMIYNSVAETRFTNCETMLKLTHQRLKYLESQNFTLKIVCVANLMIACAAVFCISAQYVPKLLQDFIQIIMVLLTIIIVYYGNVCRRYMISWIEKHREKDSCE